MKKTLAVSVVIAFALFIRARAAEAASEIPVKVSGAIAQPSDWTLTRLKSELAAEIKPIEYTSHGQKHTANCVALLALLKQSGVPFEIKTGPGADPKTKNLPLRLAVIVRASDGYAATVSLAELMPDFGNKEAWLAMDMDGKPLSEKDGPLRLIIPSDGKAGRWVHGITEIVVMDAATATEGKP